MLRMLLSLTLIGGVCGALLVGTHALTQADIQLNRDALARALMTDMLGTELPENFDMDASPFGACDNWVFQNLSVNGYAGNIELRVLWRADSTMSFRVTTHRETPGIGDFIDHQRDTWMLSLDGATAADIAAIDNVTGATITTNAIREAARRSSLAIEAYCRV